MTPVPLLARPATAIAAAVGAVVMVAMLVYPSNDAYYVKFINFDPQGPAQQFEWARVTAYMTTTSGLLCGQLIAMLLGTLLFRRFGGVFRTLIVAVPIAVMLALLNLAVAWELGARSRRGSR